jgi:mannose-1-phosphate guanylyltransferase
MVAALKEYEKEYGVTITFSVETEPLGTAGPLALAREILGKDETPFFVLNSDVICDYPFEKIRDFHASHGNEGTIIVSLYLYISGDTSFIYRICVFFLGYKSR